MPHLLFGIMLWYSHITSDVKCISQRSVYVTLMTNDWVKIYIYYESKAKDLHYVSSILCRLGHF